MASDSIPITKAGAEALKRELKHLKAVERPKNVQDISTARDHGDLRENAEFHAAKEKQSHLDGRIQYIEDRLARADIIDVSKLSGERIVFGATVKLEDVESGAKVCYRVVFGATVKLEDTESGAQVVYRVVGETEADLKKGKISITSPIARGVVGREVGDTVKIKTPGGDREYEILEVVFAEYTVEDDPE